MQFVESHFSSQSEPSDEDDLYAARRKKEALKFENLMDDELDGILQSSSETRAIKQRQVHFAPTNEVTQDATLHAREQDDELYDEDEDELNAQWVRDNLPGGTSRNSDAVLNCPGCMTLLSVDCHRDGRWKTHYQSTNPINCVIDETCRAQASETHTRQRKRPKSSHKQVGAATLEPETADLSPTLFPVSCEVCGVPVGTKDPKTNVVTFDNVLSSHT
ncbi:E2F-associated phosphoprotein, variant 2 [Clonorchis sinensis]|uniref:E2F-associated phosphoprotein, variant 2 n=1 Tax=Clonorchis sinensis TaxID=79923 RepID=A0A3R7H9V6_CLOSI|nr:E2F-associated phosphoprotein, variant 2 [Clonorchis sinensis]